MAFTGDLSLEQLMNFQQIFAVMDRYTRDLVAGLSTGGVSLLGNLRRLGVSQAGFFLWIRIKLRVSCYEVSQHIDLQAQLFENQSIVFRVRHH